MTKEQANCGPIVRCQVILSVIVNPFLIAIIVVFPYFQGGWEAVVKFLNDARSPRLISNHTVGSLISANDAAAAAANEAASSQDSPAAAPPFKTGSGDATELFGFRRGMGLINKLASKSCGTNGTALMSILRCISCCAEDFS